MLLEYGGLSEGAVLSGQLCPSCNGGVNKETSMSVGKTDGLLWWRCHRNKCDFRGLHGTRGSSDYTPVQHQRGRWNYEREPLSKDWLDWLSNRFRILNEIIDREWQWTNSYGGRVVMPLKSERNIVTAYTLRSYLDPAEGEADQKQGHRKALIHRVMEEAGQAWYQSCPYPSHVVIVEDQPSALKASLTTNVNAIALTGTHIPDSLIEKIRWTYTHNPIVAVALDQDATPEAVRQVVSLRSALPTLRVFPLDEDIKNMDDEEYTYTMNRIKEMK